MSETTNVLVGITAQHNEIVKRVGNGSLDSENVRKGLQQIIEGNFPEVIPAHVGSPSWCISPEQQLERVRQLNTESKWGFKESDFPSIPEDFTPRTATEVLLLAVYLPDKKKQSGMHRTFDELWEVFQAPSGYKKWRSDLLVTDDEHLRQAPGYDWQPGIRWVAFDPNAYHDRENGISPEAALAQAGVDGSSLAGVEVLLAAVLFPVWTSSWNGKDSPFPNISGLQVYYDIAWSRVPYVNRWDGSHELKLDAYWADYAGSEWASPTVREC